MDAKKISTIATTIIAFIAFLATWAAIIYYSVEAFGFRGLTLSLISEIYILSILLFISWITEKIK